MSGGLPVDRRDSTAVVGRGRGREILLGTAVAFVVCIVLARFVAIPAPLLPSDEFLYAFRSKYGWRAFAGESGIILLPAPNLLYFQLTRWVHAFGDDAIFAARAFNVLLFAAATLPIVLVARRFVPSWAAVVIALIACAGPTGSYAAYFTPESMYVLGFWLVVLAFVRMLEDPNPGRIAVLSVSLAALALVKPHAFVLAPCFAATLPLSRAFGRQRASFAALMLRGAALLLGGYLSWVLLGRLLGREWIWSPAGVLYAGLARNMLGVADVSRTLATTLSVTTAHVSLILLPLGTAVVLVVAGPVQELREPSEARPPRIEGPFAVACMMVVVVLVLMSIRLTVTAVGMDRWATVDRVHGRYYCFALPLLLLAAAAVSPREWGRTARWVAASSALVIAVMSYLVVIHLPTLYVVDYPEGFALTASSSLRLLALAGGILGAALLLLRPAWAWTGSLCAVALVAALGTQRVWEGQRARASVSDVDRMGVILSGLLAADERDRAVVFSREVDVRSFAVGMHLLSRTRFYQAPELQGDGCRRVPSSARWLVTLDPMPVACGFSRVLTIGSNDLFHRDTLDVAPAAHP
jgi:phosphoglycerol transferase